MAYSHWFEKEKLFKLCCRVPLVIYRRISSAVVKMAERMVITATVWVASESRRYGIPNGGGLFHMGAAPGRPASPSVVYLIRYSCSLLDNF